MGFDTTTLTDPSALETEGNSKFDSKPEPPPLVPGRVLYVDADFLAYQYGFRWEEEGLDVSKNNLEVGLQTLRLLAGAEIAELHLTMGDKAGRFEVAMVQEYQAPRKDNKDPRFAERVAQLRNHMIEAALPNIVPAPQYKQEADDSLAQAMWKAHRFGDPTKAVLWSLDKDLYMVGGLHMNKDYEIEAFPWGYGSIELCRETTQTKIVGQGTSFFWAQMLCGDGADNIPGLPTLHRDLVLKYCPKPKYYTAAYERKAKTQAQKIAKRKAIEKAEAKIKAKPCGAVTAYEVLKSCRSDVEAYRRVKECYELHYGPRFYLDCWDGQTREMTSGDMLLEQARLLWMQREEGQDVLDWMKETLSG